MAKIQAVNGLRVEIFLGKYYHLLIAWIGVTAIGVQASSGIYILSIEALTLW